MDWASALRSDLSQRAAIWAANGSHSYYKSLGSSPTVLFERTDGGSAHGNFHPDSWSAIGAIEGCLSRLAKPHSQKRALPKDKGLHACEMDSSNSSDVLLMNCFCFPGASKQICKTLNLAPGGEAPIFGFEAEVPLLDGTGDATEIDMRMGSILFETKLTEKDFTKRPKAYVQRYRYCQSTLKSAPYRQTMMCTSATN